MLRCGAPWIGWASREKKTPRASEQDRPDVQQEREVFQRLIEQVDPKRLFYFDEFGLNLSMTRRYALAPSGERAYGIVPFNPGVTMTLVLGLGLLVWTSLALLTGLITFCVMMIVASLAFVSPEAMRALGSCCRPVEQEEMQLASVRG